MRFVKPLDKALIETLHSSHELLVTIEENSVAGGAGSGVAEHLSAQGLIANIMHIGLDDTYMAHATPASMRHQAKLDATGIIDSIETRLKQGQYEQRAAAVAPLK